MHILLQKAPGFQKHMLWTIFLQEGQVRKGS